MIGLIPARGGSKSVPNKNIKPICGRPLLYWVMDAACKSNLNKTYVSTDSNLIAKIANHHWGDAEAIDRDPSTATDEASTASVMLDFMNRIHFDSLMVIQCTSPLLTEHDINGGMELFNTGKYDSVVSVVRQKRFVWYEKNGFGFPKNHTLYTRPRRQDWDGMLVENGAFIITSRDALKKSESRLSGKVGLYEMPEYTYTEIDEPSDWIITEKLLEEACQGRLITRR